LVINFMNFFFTFFLLIPFISLLLELYFNLNNHQKKAWALWNWTRIKFWSRQGFLNLTLQDCYVWDAEFSHLQRSTMAIGDYHRSSITLALVVSKTLSTLTSVLALFLNFDVKQALWLAFVAEMAVLIYIIIPSSTVTFRMVFIHLIQRMKL
jgi:hypothetical protein